jgi:hypothetical protein
MLVIRKEQMDVLSNYQLELFVKRVVEHLTLSFPDKTGSLKQKELEDLIRKGVDSAEKYDIDDESDVERYLDYVIRFGASFDIDKETAWASEILNNQEINGTEKMNQIDDYVLFQLSTD